MPEFHHPSAPHQTDRSTLDNTVNPNDRTYSKRTEHADHTVRPRCPAPSRRSHLRALPARVAAGVACLGAVAAVLFVPQVSQSARALVQPDVAQQVLGGPTGSGAGHPATSVGPGATAARSQSTSHAPASARVDCRVSKCLALTFDDGPGPMTPTLMHELDAAGVKATFFEIGQHVQQHPDITRMLVADGMVVGNHTWSHPQLPHLSASDQQQQIDRTRDALVAAGAPAPTLLRPPYGDFNSATRQLGEAVVLWNVDSEDWKNHSVAISTQKVLRESRRGSIVLMHDIQPSTIAAVPGIITALKARGFTFVTVPQLLNNPAPGSVNFAQQAGTTHQSHGE